MRPVIVHVVQHLSRGGIEAYALGLRNGETALKLQWFVRSVQTYSGVLLEKLSTINRQRSLRRPICLSFAG